MKITELKKQLNAMDKAELISMLCKLYKANRQCQAILDVEMCGTSAEAPIIESCRKKIHDAFFGRQLSLKNARAVISDFRKASQNKESIADLILYYVECGVEFKPLWGYRRTLLFQPGIHVCRFCHDPQQHGERFVLSQAIEAYSSSL